MLEARERVLGKEHPETLQSVNNLAVLYQDQGRYQEAGPLFISVRWKPSERVLGKEHPETLRSVNNLALPLFTRRATGAGPLIFGSRSTAAIVRREQRGALTVARGPTGKKESETERFNGAIPETCQGNVSASRRKAVRRI